MKVSFNSTQLGNATDGRDYTEFGASLSYTITNLENATSYAVTLTVIANNATQQEPDEGVRITSETGENADNDAQPDHLDNCPMVFNSDQTNTDKERNYSGGDKDGDACDPDDDNDGVNDTKVDRTPLDNCRLIPNPDQRDGESGR